MTTETSFVNGGKYLFIHFDINAVTQHVNPYLGIVAAVQLNKYIYSATESIAIFTADPDQRMHPHAGLSCRASSMLCSGDGQEIPNILHQSMCNTDVDIRIFFSKLKSEIWVMEQMKDPDVRYMQVLLDAVVEMIDDMFGESVLIVPEGVGVDGVPEFSVELIPTP